MSDEKLGPHIVRKDVSNQPTIPFEKLEEGVYQTGEAVLTDQGFVPVSAGRPRLREPVVLEPGKLMAWQCAENAPLIRTATQTREWMEKAHDRFPYRCLPLVIANQYGWDIINPATFSATWNGGASPSDVTITWPPSTKKTSNLPQAHFGNAVLTFTLGHLFETPPGINLWCMGPPNEPKDGIIPLQGIIETDWLPATFTMNWLFTRKNHPRHLRGRRVLLPYLPHPPLHDRVPPASDRHAVGPETAPRTTPLLAGETRRVQHRSQRPQLRLRQTEVAERLLPGRRRPLAPVQRPPNSSGPTRLPGHPPGLHPEEGPGSCRRDSSHPADHSWGPTPDHLHPQQGNPP